MPALPGKHRGAPCDNRMVLPRSGALEAVAAITANRNIMTPRWPKAVLLDLDDTILSFDAGAAGCWQAICARFAPRLDTCDAAALLAAIDATRRWFWSDPERHRRGRLDLETARREIVTASLLRLGAED